MVNTSSFLMVSKAKNTVSILYFVKVTEFLRFNAFWLGAWPVWHSLGNGSWVGICRSRHSFPYNSSWRLWNTGVSWKLLGGRRDVVALKPPKADVPPVSNWRSCLIVAVTLHFEKVVSAGKVADLQRVGMLSSLGEFSISLRTACCSTLHWNFWPPPGLPFYKHLVCRFQVPEPLQAPSCRKGTLKVPMTQMWGGRTGYDIWSIKLPWSPGLHPENFPAGLRSRKV